MGRSERSLGNRETPAEILAGELRQLREQAGNPTYLKMHRACGKIRSKTALSEAAGGDHLPTWETLEAFLIALQLDPASWRRRWEDAQDEERVRRLRVHGDGVDVPPVSPHGMQRPLPQEHARTSVTSPPVRRSALAFAAGAATATAALGALWLVTPTRVGFVAQSVPAVVLVQNKEAVGATNLVQRSTPLYLSARPFPYCSELGCEISGTHLNSGSMISVVCRTNGAAMTNEDLASKGISRNPAGIFSNVWYRAVLPKGKTGYIPVVFLKPRFRDYSGLPHCR